IFKEFAGVDAFPLCLATKDVDEIVTIVKAISPVFGGINLEDISAPRCFEIEERLQRDLEIPVFHDDQHGTAVVVLASLLNALKVVRKRLSDVRIVFTGVGASGIATAKLLMKAGAKHIIGCDRAGAIYRGRTENMNSMKEWFAQHTNPKKLRGTAGDALVGADVFIGLSGPGVVGLKDIKAMRRDAIVFAMANPIPEIQPEEAGPHVKVMATGRSDYPNQINNSCCFPGFFRGMLDVRARRVNDQMKLAAATALAELVGRDELDPEYITPSMFDRRVVPAVAEAVSEAAVRTGVARRKPRTAGGRSRYGPFSGLFSGLAAHRACTYNPSPIRCLSRSPVFLSRDARSRLRSYVSRDQGEAHARSESPAQGAPSRRRRRIRGQYHRVVRLLHLREPGLDPGGEVLREGSPGGGLPQHGGDLLGRIPDPAVGGVRLRLAR